MGPGLNSGPLDLQSDTIVQLKVDLYVFENTVYAEQLASNEPSYQ